MRRHSLFEIDTYLYCSIIGTCLTPSEARKILSESIPVSIAENTDYMIHSIIITKLKNTQSFSNKVTKYLDNKFRVDIYSTKEITDINSLISFWNESCDKGNIPGAYWAILTNPLTSAELKKTVFGDVHMLSHLANEKEILTQQKIQKLKEEVKILSNDLKIYKSKLYKMTNKRDLIQKNLKSLKIDKTLLEKKYNKIKNEESTISNTKKLKDKINILKQKNSNLISTNQQLKEKLSIEKDYKNIECELIKKVSPPLQIFSEEHQNKSCDLNNQHVLFVGGRPSMIPHCKDIVENMNGVFEYHDGGREQSSFTLRKLATKADIVICALDCVSHDATRCVKKICKGADQKIIMLNKSGLSAFTRELKRSV